MKTNISKISETLYIITLSLPIPGFNRFMNVWVSTGSPSFILDAGPAAAFPELKTALNELNISKVDYLLLTHIHMDHAGGIAKRHVRPPPIGGGMAPIGYAGGVTVAVTAIRVSAA